MNQIDTGKFIASCRKEKGLTQAQLAEKLNITDRAVSKWETGKCMPDSSIMLELCNILDVTVNELLSGERIEMNNYEEKVNENSKIQMKYYIYDNAQVISEKFYDIKEMKELNIAYLNGLNATFSSSIKGIIKGLAKLDILMYHNFLKTKSNTENKFVTIQDGVMKLNVTSLVYHNRKQCTLNQNNFILNQNNSESFIKPNLLIEENDVEASHSANIAPMDEEILFYMQTRGIDKDMANKMLLKGFLNTNIVEVDKLIQKYWR